VVENCYSNSAFGPLEIRALICPTIVSTLFVGFEEARVSGLESPRARNGATPKM
jgi:hypothetical protein